MNLFRAFCSAQLIASDLFLPRKLLVNKFIHSGWMAGRTQNAYIPLPPFYQRVKTVGTVVDQVGPIDLNSEVLYHDSQLRPGPLKDAAEKYGYYGGKSGYFRGAERLGTYRVSDHLYLGLPDGMTPEMAASPRYGGFQPDATGDPGGWVFRNSPIITYHKFIFP